jgi:hypothetical protein
MEKYISNWKQLVYGNGYNPKIALLDLTWIGQ